MFFKKDKENNNNFLIKISALLIHAAKIDENYTHNEEEIIKKTLRELGLEKEKITETIEKAKIIEENSNQILDFTREIKNINKEDKIIIIESLWNIIYSDENADMYETNLMRRLSGLLYLDPKVVGNIKEKVRQKKI